MDSNVLLHKISPILSVSSCIILSIIYVSSLYVWSTEHNRDHPTTIKKRFLSVFIVMLISPAFIYLFTSNEILEGRSIWAVMGFRTEGLWMALFTPLILTAILFLGPLMTQALNGIWDIYADPNYWAMCLQNLLWIRNHVVAPLSEEFTFRACMMPLLLQSFKPLSAVAITPMFFGIGHLHHIIERLRAGLPLKTILIVSGIQFCYTSIFGMYAAYLFARTGHFMAPVVAHAFCNHMGFPDVNEVLNQPTRTKHILLATYVIGFVAWIYLLPVVTDPTWYANDLYWTKESS
ncbi:CAAX prenyl protease 2 [Bradysia coprophila]|uniref:CAAX prenyl protease 2 n=1 Tax=Bradysia coprophila TaxID=38358 RepID=UPI00187DA21B|nr:CAAX prenyl protease 2 [Bradysia coprophila]